MNAKTSFLVAVLWCICGSVTAWAQGFAGLGAKEDGFALVVPGRQITFPNDFGPHSEFRIEWWYVTANLQAEDGQKLGVQWTLFRQAAKPGPVSAGFSTKEFWLGHAAVTTQDQHKFAERLARGGTGQAGAIVAPFEAWIDDWHLSENNRDAAPEKSYRLFADGDSFSYNLRLEQTGLPVLHGQEGFSRKSDQGQASYYFSLPSLAANGTVTLNGKTLKVAGSAWLDREWSSQPLAENQEGWDWFSLRLQGGEKVMLFRLRGADGEAFLSGTWVRADGQSETIAAENIRLEPQETSTVAGREVPTKWSLAVSSKNVAITVTPLNPNSWMATGISYWEGPVIAAGSHSGEGYLEMTGY